MSDFYWACLFQKGQGGTTGFWQLCGSKESAIESVANRVLQGKAEAGIVKDLAGDDSDYIFMSGFRCMRQELNTGDVYPTGKVLLHIVK
jgi:hypothetical protein